MPDDVDVCPKCKGASPLFVGELGWCALWQVHSEILSDGRVGLICDACNGGSEINREHAGAVTNA